MTDLTITIKIPGALKDKTLQGAKRRKPDPKQTDLAFLKQHLVECVREFYKEKMIDDDLTVPAANTALQASIETTAQTITAE